MAEINPNVAVITVNSNSQIKRQKNSDCMQNIKSGNTLSVREY